MELYGLALCKGKKQKYLFLFWPKCLEYNLRIRHVGQSIQNVLN